MYYKKYYFNVYEFPEEQIHALAAKLGNRLVLIQVSTSVASP